MLRNYLRVAFRNIQRNAGYSFINIAGLAIGLATCLLILVYVLDELSYDRFNQNADRIYRIDGDIRLSDHHSVTATAPGPLGPTLKQDYPEVEQIARFRKYGGLLVRKGAQNIAEDHVIFADSSLFQVFTLPMIAGDPLTALREPHTIVITERIARKYFGNMDVIGQNLLINDKDDYKITGVIKDLPSNAHFHFDFFLPLAQSDESRRDDQWLNNNFNTYVLLHKGTDARKFARHFDEIVNKYIAPREEAILHTTMQAFTGSGHFIRYSLMPLADIHLHSDKISELGPNSDIAYVYIFSAIALFILMIACVNFMNLSTARSSNRAREVGIRKVLGSLRPQLIIQFITESTLISFIGMTLALGISLLLLPYFNQLAARQISPDLFFQPLLLLTFLGMVLFVGLLAGSYPAFFLSAFRPVLVLKGTLASGFRTGWLRNSLVVFQFAVSIVLIVGTSVIYGQLDYIRSKKIGFDREQVLVVKNPYSLGQGTSSFREKVLGLAGVQGATMTGYLPTSPGRNTMSYFLSPAMTQSSFINLQSWSVDDQYIPVLGMEMSKGRNFSKEFPTDSQAIVINEAAARLISLPDPLNHKLYVMPALQGNGPASFTIIGVVKDFNFNSLRQEVTPLVMKLGGSRNTIALRTHTDNMPKLIRAIESEWKAIAPTQPFNYTFMDEDFNALYASDNRIGRICLCFSVLAVFIACLGLFGLAAFAAEQRTREIGIRKVLGATVTNIYTLLCKDFLKLVAISALIAFPLAWFYMHHWLEGFAYRMPIGWQIFGLTAAAVSGITLLTVSLQAIRAALANPADSLQAR